MTKLNKISWNTIKKKKYIVIENKVYDVSEFKMRHPGGSQILEDWMGKDATEIFNNVRHTPHAHSMLKDFYKEDLDTDSQESQEGLDYWMISILIGIVSVILVFVYIKIR
ncbi:hypothetical protein GVAV_000149 [Gurleya vavrai]